MDVRPAVREALLTDTAIFAAVDDRVYPLFAPQGERRQLLVVNRVSEVDEPTLKGGSGLLTSRVQIDAWAPTTDEAAALAGLVRSRMHGLFGLFGGLIITGAFAVTIREDRDAETGAWRCGRDYTIYTRLP